MIELQSISERDEDGLKIFQSFAEVFAQKCFLC